MDVHPGPTFDAVLALSARVGYCPDPDDRSHGEAVLHLRSHPDDLPDQLVSADEGSHGADREESPT
jgi:hypothetical protein